MQPPNSVEAVESSMPLPFKQVVKKTYFVILIL